jgi:hypothetical protein
VVDQGLDEQRLLRLQEHVAGRAIVACRRILRGGLGRRRRNRRERVRGRGSAHDADAAQKFAAFDLQTGFLPRHRILPDFDWVAPVIARARERLQTIGHPSKLDGFRMEA